MHAERCVVCNGHGKIRQPTGTAESNTAIVDCHGCKACGWLTVLDMADVPAVAEKAPTTKRVYLSPGLARRLLEDDEHKYKGRVRDDGYELTQIWIGNFCLTDLETNRG